MKWERHDPEREIRREADAITKEAWGLMKEWNETKAINLALRGVPEGRKRDRLFGMVRKEITKLKREKKQREIDLEDARSQIRMQDAYAHEKRQPKDTYSSDNDNEEAT